MPDSQPNYLTVDAAGNIGADFSGHLSATGIDFVALGIFGLPEANIRREAISWFKDTLTGARVARIVAYGDGLLVASATHPTNGVVSRADFIAMYAPGTNNNVISVTVDNQTARIIDGIGDSDFALLNRIRGLTLQGPFTGGASSDKTITNVPAGKYYVSFQAGGYGNAGGPGGVLLYLTGVNILQSFLFFNQANMHMIAGPTMAVYTHAGGNILVQARQTGQLLSDGNDNGLVLFIPIAPGTTVP